MLRVATDENFGGKVLRALLARLPDLDVVRVASGAYFRRRHLVVGREGFPRHDLAGHRDRDGSAGAVQCWGPASGIEAVEIDRLFRTGDPEGASVAPRPTRSRRPHERLPTGNDSSWSDLDRR